MSKASAPGKVIIIGEHAVVYGEPAIIAAIGKRTYSEAEKSIKCRYMDSRWNVDLVFTIEEALSTMKKADEIWKICSEKKDFTELLQFIKRDGFINYRKAVFGIMIKKMKINECFTIKIKSDVPVGSGLGSSSSLAVAVTKSVSELFKKNISNEAINDIAYEMEKLIHGNPSGGDNAASCFGGLLWFEKGKEIKSLEKKVPYELENFVLVYTGPPKKTTGELVQAVRNLDENYRNKRIKEIGKMTSKILNALKKKDFKKMKEIINKTQHNLSELGVSTPVIDKIAKAVIEINGAAKLCGAGGGGIMLCWYEDKSKLIKTIKSLGYEPIETELGAEGVRTEKY